MGAPTIQNWMKIQNYKKQKKAAKKFFKLDRKNQTAKRGGFRK